MSEHKKYTKKVGMVLGYCKIKQTNSYISSLSLAL